jgi:hypothetical protein
MSEAVCREKIYEAMSMIPHVGRLYDYERWAADWSKFISYFKHPSGFILGWEICRSSMQSVKTNNIEEERLHRFVVKGYMSVKDSLETEKIFNGYIDQICELFRGNHTLDGVCEDAGPVSAETIDTRSFGGVLCHYAELIIPVTEYASGYGGETTLFGDMASILFGDGSEVTT